MYSSLKYYIYIYIYIYISKCIISSNYSDGVGRAGTYVLIDMVLNRMAKGCKEIDIAATLEHIRDQRSGMVQTRPQFEFCLMAVAEEVHAILKALLPWKYFAIAKFNGHSIPLENNIIWDIIFYRWENHKVKMAVANLFESLYISGEKEDSRKNILSQILYHHIHLSDIFDVFII